MRITSLNASKYDTRGVVLMNSMFFKMSSLTSLDLSSFHNDNLENDSNIFEGCSLLKEIYFGPFSTVELLDMAYIFKVCTSLSSLDLTSLIHKKSKQWKDFFIIV